MILALFFLSRFEQGWPDDLITSSRSRPQEDRAAVFQAFVSQRYCARDDSRRHRRSVDTQRRSHRRMRTIVISCRRAFSTISTCSAPECEVRLHGISNHREFMLKQTSFPSVEDY